MFESYGHLPQQGNAAWMEVQGLKDMHRISGSKDIGCYSFSKGETCGSEQGGYIVDNVHIMQCIGSQIIFWIDTLVSGAYQGIGMEYYNPQQALSCGIQLSMDSCCRTGISGVKKQIHSIAVLAFWSSEKISCLYMNASELGLGCFLTQLDEDGKKELVIAFESVALMVI